MPNQNHSSPPSPYVDNQPINSISIAKDVIVKEANALLQMAESLNESIDHAVSILMTNTGRVIVSGMGKSGHIGKKIAATLASTGQPAYFVHPGEASHGDLGMITANDRLLLLSNSGESYELTAMIDYAKRYNIPIVAITKNPKSTLGRFSAITLLTPNVEEACPMGLAPTTSTTATLALGDALAVAILSKRNFKAEHFKNYHPGGKLGQQLLQVGQVMHTGASLPLVKIETLMSDALVEMSKKSFGCVGVINQEKNLIGIITDGDLRRHMSQNLLNLPVENVMSPNPQVASPLTLVSEVIQLMNEKSITSLFVKGDDFKPIGIVHIHDCLRAGKA